ncbi:2-hydroxychromene-2-carboxylate isomerase [Shimia sp. R11_0]|uniref:2-hydroxychromene-2-carboxylate isomerase n=1 Tax=Shimia sp. R11_0 TaxID=2821096 RepID=UPI001ADA685D|nr:2-hydroxychromene-2-carboxylate isomerase [Shimia sp. R11_0]MBO9478798.1 2-hydroxychromene-2-carboxylate isomerase [Shimia sp. R11_0]
MSEKTIEYFYSTHSAYAYLGAPRLMEICQAQGYTLVHRPFELSPVVEQAGGLSFAGRTQAHVDYFFGREIERWAEYRGLEVIDHRPIYHDNPLRLSSGALLAAEDHGLDLDALSFAFLQAHWRDDIDLNDPEALATACRSVGVDPAPLLTAAMTPAIQARFDANTQRAKDLNLFGSPSYVVDGEIFYGQDHLELMAHALSHPFRPSTFKNPPVSEG